MNNNSEIDALNAICREAKREGKLSGKNLTALYELFGQRFTKALNALKENRVKKYVFKPSGRNVWIVIGSYHLIAQKIARNLGWYETIEENDNLYESLMNEWKKATA